MASIGQPKKIDLTGLTFTPPPDQRNFQSGTKPGVDNANTTSPVSPPKIETTISTKDMAKGLPTTQVVDNSGLLKNIQTTYDKYGGQAGANEAFVRGAIKAAGQTETPELIAQYSGKKLGDVISGLGFGEKITGFGITPPTIAPDAPKSPTSDVKPEKVEIPTARDRIAELDEMASAMSGSIDQAYKDAGVQAYAENVNKIQSEIDKLDVSDTVRGVMASIDSQDLKDQFAEFERGLNEAGAETARNKGIILGQRQDEINQKLQGLSSQQVRDLATYTLNRTNLTQQLQVAQGNYQIASDIAKQSAESMKWAYEQKLNLYSQLNLIDQDEKKELTTKNDDDFSKMEKGYVQITPDQEKKYEQDILSGKAEGSIYTDVYGQKWFKPKEVKMGVLEEYAGKAAIDALYETGKIKDSKIVDIGGTQYLQITYPDGTTTFTKPDIPADNQSADKATSQLDLVQKSLDNAKSLASASGNVGALGKLGRWFTGTDKYTNLVAETNTLRTNLLTLMTDPAIKKFFGPQMSNADVQLMTSAATSLNPELQSPEKMKAELTRIQDLMDRMKSSVQGRNAFSAEDYSIQNPQEADKIRNMLNNGLSDEDIGQIYGFTKVDGDTNKAIVSENIGGKTIKINSSISDLLKKADADMYKSTGSHLLINQSFRTREQQAKLYEELSKKGAQVAPPGKSFHEKGMAIDVSNWKEAEPYLRKYGLKNNLANDKGHFSFGEFA